MYIDLLPIEGKYRGVSRHLGLKNVKLKKWQEFTKIYDKYLDWLAKQDNSFNESVLQVLKELRDAMLTRGSNCEIICYTDNPEEFYLGKGFLGFDAYWVNESLSVLEGGSQIEENFINKINRNGLFPNYEDAQVFCETQMKAMASSEQQCEREANIRPFCIWVYQD